MNECSQKHLRLLKHLILNFEGFFCILINLLLLPKENPHIQLHDFIWKSKPEFRKLGASIPFGCVKKAFEAEDYSLKPFKHWCIRQGDALWNLKERTPVRIKVGGDSWWPVGNHVVPSKWWVTEKERNKEKTGRDSKPWTQGEGGCCPHRMLKRVLPHMEHGEKNTAQYSGASQQVKATPVASVEGKAWSKPSPVICTCI